MKRYEINSNNEMEECPTGEWVKHSAIQPYCEGCSDGMENEGCYTEEEGTY